MTVETFAPAPTYTIATTGPYAIPFEYHGQSEIVAIVSLDDASVELALDLQFTVDPDELSSSGSLTLTASAYAAYNGWTLKIERRTIIEQGWTAQGGAREAGLEVQLDRIVRAIQDNGLGLFFLNRQTLRMEPSVGAIPALNALDVAGKILGFDGTGLPFGMPPKITYGQTVSTFDTTQQAALISPDADATWIFTRGYYVVGDGGGAFFKRAANEPGHDGKLKTADDAWWELAESDPNPIMFGAKWNGSTDDVEMIQACLDYCRAKGLPARFPAGETYASDTIYGGGVKIIGAGAPNNSEKATSRSVVYSNGNPILSQSRSAANQQSFGLTQWEDFTLAGAGGSVSNIEIWDTLSYPSQIGIWLGRNHNHVQSISGGEAPTSGGAGGVTIRRVNVEDVSGWGLYGYKLWGKSVMSDMFFRRCGGAHAASVGNDRTSGMMRFDSLCVDYVVENVHGYGKGYADPAWDARGCGIRIGSDKPITDGLGREWERGNYGVFKRIHVEGYNTPLDIRSNVALFLDHCSLNGNNATNDGKIRIGRGRNPSTDMRIIMSNTRIGHIDTIFLGGTSLIDLGKIIVATPTVGIEVRYWTGVAADFLGKAVDFTGVYAPDITWTPEPDATSQEGGIGSRPEYTFTPLLITDNEPADLLCNRLPDFGSWTDDGAGVTSLSMNNSRLTIRDGSTMYYELMGLDPDDLYTLHVWMEVTGSAFLQNIEYGTKNGGGSDIFRRAFGSGSASAGSYYAVANVKPIESGLLRVFVTNAGGNNIDFIAPILIQGAGRPMSRKPPSLLPTSIGMISVD